VGALRLRARGELMIDRLVERHAVALHRREARPGRDGFVAALGSAATTRPRWWRSSSRSWPTTSCCSTTCNMRPHSCGSLFQNS
jgi:hypothetical protein